MQVILGTKIGMTQIIGDDGVVTPVTILEAGPCTVTQIKFSGMKYKQTRNISPESPMSILAKDPSLSFVWLF